MGITFEEWLKKHKNITWDEYLKISKSKQLVYRFEFNVFRKV